MLLLSAFALLLLAGTLMAEGPGSRIRSGSDLPRLPESLPRDPAKPCARLQGIRQRCLDEERRPVEAGRPGGPESTGTGSGGGTGTSGGKSGGAPVGPGAPR